VRVGYGVIAHQRGLVWACGPGGMHIDDEARQVLDTGRDVHAVCPGQSPTSIWAV
jgi:hypothetical protein